MAKEYVTIYTQAGTLAGVLENASDVSYRLVHNDLWTASFSLPSADPKNALCEAHNLVRIPDGGRDTGLYRIIGMPTGEETARGGIRVYSLEHVMATLLDDVLFGYHEIGGLGVTTSQVLRYILERQSVRRWVLGACDFEDQYAYKFENTSLLTALLSLGNVLVDDYTWVFDTSVSPWRVSLLRADANPGCGIHYQRSMVGVEKTMDASTLVTRLYLLGYGEGVNQLTVQEVNGGLPYIDADTASKWGVKASVFADTRIEDARTLLARGRVLLERLKNPYFSYTASAVDLFQLTGLAWDGYMPGRLVAVMDDEHHVRFQARIVSIAKSDALGRPGEMEITIANAPRDAADSINTLADRMGISELYSQGATNLYSQQYADNADEEHPAVMRVYVPSGCVRINQMLLSWRLSAFRTYATGAEAGGGTVATTDSGGASTQTSSEGGGSERTSASGGEYTATLAQRVITHAATTGQPITGGLGGSTAGDTGQAKGTSGGVMTATGSSGEHSHTVAGHRHSFSGADSVGGHDHYHNIGSPGSSAHTQGASANPTHHISISGQTSETNVILTGTSKGHTHNMAHYHNFSHYHDVTVSLIIPSQDITVPAHSHVFKTNAHTHTVSVPSHQHDVILTNHAHELVYGIYEGGTAGRVTLRIDGEEVPQEESQRDEMDIVRYLAKDEDGRITRGAWHEIELVPDELTRIEANLFIQTFVQSIGGGDY